MRYVKCWKSKGNDHQKPDLPSKKTGEANGFAFHQAILQNDLLGLPTQTLKFDNHGVAIHLPGISCGLGQVVFIGRQAGSVDLR